MTAEYSYSKHSDIAMNPDPIRAGQDSSRRLIEKKNALFTVNEYLQTLNTNGYKNTDQNTDLVMLETDMNYKHYLPEYLVFVRNRLITACFDKVSLSLCSVMDV